MVALVLSDADAALLVEVLDRACAAALVKATSDAIGDVEKHIISASDGAPQFAALLKEWAATLDAAQVMP